MPACNVAFDQVIQFPVERGSSVGIVAAVGWLLTKKLSPWIRLPVQVALAMIGSLTALALPFLGKPGLRPDNPSLLSRNYPVGYGIYVTIILVAAALWAARRRVTVGSTRGDT